MQTDKPGVCTVYKPGVLKQYRKKHVRLLSGTQMVQVNVHNGDQKCTITAASKARAASWQCPVACSLQPACKGEGWWLKGFSASGIMCISAASLVLDAPASPMLRWFVQFDEEI